MKTLTKLLVGVTLTICTVGAANASGYEWNSYHYSYNQPYNPPQGYKVTSLDQASRTNDYVRNSDGYCLSLIRDINLKTYIIERELPLACKNMQVRLLSPPVGCGYALHKMRERIRQAEMASFNQWR